MQPGLEGALLTAAAFFGGACVAILWRCLGPRLAIVATVLKVGLCAGYFLWYRDQGFRLLDDQTYFATSVEILSRGYDPFTLLSSPEGLGTLFSIVGGEHVAYTYLNVLAMWAFGPFMFVPVLFNVTLTCVAACLLTSIASQSGFSKEYTRYLGLFFVLHWDILAWSSFLNLKDTLSLTMALMALWSVVQLRSNYRNFGRAAIAVALGGSALFVLTYLRFYLPVIILAASIVWVLIGTHRRKEAHSKLLLFVLAASVLAVVSLRIDWSFYLQGLSGSNAAANLVRIALTPQPWAIDDEYSFLLLPSLLHWALFVPSVYGVIRLAGVSHESRLLILFSILTVALFSIGDAFTGPRQRLAVTPLLVWGQYHFIVLAMRARCKSVAEGEMVKA